MGGGPGGPPGKVEIQRYLGLEALEELPRQPEHLGARVGRQRRPGCGGEIPGRRGPGQVEEPAQEGDPGVQGVHPAQGKREGQQDGRMDCL